MLASTTSIVSGCFVDSQKSVLPHTPQNDRAPWSEETWRTSCSAPFTTASRFFSMPNQVTKPAPWLRRHMVQWQWAQKVVGGVASKRTAPQKQEPATGPVSAVFKVSSGRSGWTHRSRVRRHRPVR